jgi:hypothetical protein
MQEIKYWKVELFRNSDKQPGLAGMTSPIQPFFMGYSREKPDLTRLLDQRCEYIELYTGPEMLASSMYRLDAFDYVNLTPVHDAGEKLCDIGQAGAADDQPSVLSGLEEAVRPLATWLTKNLPLHGTAIADQPGTKKMLPTIYLFPKEEGGEQITYFKHHVCSVITETSPEGVPLTRVHLSNGQVINCTLEHHTAVGAIEFYNQLS